MHRGGMASLLFSKISIFRKYRRDVETLLKYSFYSNIALQNRLPSQSPCYLRADVVRDTPDDLPCLFLKFHVTRSRKFLERPIVSVHCFFFFNLE